jgi:hypothetical protein
MPRIFDATHTEEFFDSPNALITVTISGLTLEEYIRVRDTYNKVFFNDFWKHDKESKKLYTSY